MAKKLDNATVGTGPGRLEKDKTTKSSRKQLFFDSWHRVVPSADLSLLYLPTAFHLTRSSGRFFKEVFF